MTKTNSGGQELLQSPLECYGPWVKLWFPKSLYFDGRPRRISLRASKWCCFTFSLGPVQGQRHPASHRPRPSVWFAKWLSWPNPAVLVDHAGVVLRSRLQDSTVGRLHGASELMSFVTDVLCDDTQQGPCNPLTTTWLVDCACLFAKYHGRSTVFKVFNAAPRALILCQTRAPGSLFFQKTPERIRRSLVSSLDDLTSAWKYQIPVPCRVEKVPKFGCAIKPCRKLHICSEDHGIAALSGKVGPLTLEQPENALSAWRQHQHNVTCYNLKMDDKRRSC